MNLELPRGRPAARYGGTFHELKGLHKVLAAHYKIKRGLDIPIVGAPGQRIQDDAAPVTRVALVGADYHTRKRLKLLLDFISGREKDLAQAISEFTDETSNQVLNTWVQYTTDDPPIQQLLDSELLPDMTTDDLMRTTMQIAEHFISLYREMIDAADTNELREAFQSLRDREQKEKEKVARNFQMFMDM